MKKLLFAVSMLFLSGMLVQCKKETVTEFKTVTQYDTVYIAVHDTVTIPALISDTVSTFVLVRHAERGNTGADPSLNADGILRAEELKRILKNVQIKAAYTTPYNRTRETITPTASDKSISLTEYSPNTPYVQLKNDLLSNHKGETILIAGHSNTVPEILKAFSSNSFNITIGENQYDHLFIISVPGNMTPRILHMKYGKPTP